MGDNENWYRQLLALVLLSGSKAAVEFITNPSSREDATEQLRNAFAQIDYDAVAKALTRAIDDAATSSKGRLDVAIDTLRDKSVDAVDEGKKKAERQLAGKKGGRKLRFIFGLLIGGIIAYFLLDEQRRDGLLDRLTGASGPIEQTTQQMGQQVTETAQKAVDQAQSQSETPQSSEAPAT